MAFSQVTVTHRYLNLDATPASGTVEFQLTGAMRNGGVTLAASNPRIVSLDASGNLGSAAGIALSANDDTATLPLGRMYSVTEKIAGAREETYTISVPAASAGQAIDLGSLYPTDEVAS